MQHTTDQPEQRIADPWHPASSHPQGSEGTCLNADYRGIGISCSCPMVSASPSPVPSYNPSDPSWQALSLSNGVRDAGMHT